MVIVTPSIDSQIKNIAPGFRALSITVAAAPLVDTTVAQVMLDHACAIVTKQQPHWAEAHLAAWDRAYQNFGAKPKRTPCSAHALRKRVLRDGTMMHLDPVVDVYNAVSLAYAIPIGGENIAAYQGMPYLKVASGDEVFDCYKEGQAVSERVEAGEVIWCDELGATCRRWNWRQGIRTRLSAQDQQMWFILESLPEMPLDELYAAGTMLIEGLQKMMPALQAETTLIRLD